MTSEVAAIARCSKAVDQYKDEIRSVMRLIIGIMDSMDQNDRYYLSERFFCGSYSWRYSRMPKNPSYVEFSVPVVGNLCYMEVARFGPQENEVSLEYLLVMYKAMDEFIARMRERFPLLAARLDLYITIGTAVR